MHFMQGFYKDFTSSPLFAYYYMFAQISSNSSSPTNGSSRILCGVLTWGMDLELGWGDVVRLLPYPLVTSPS